MPPEESNVAQAGESPLVLRTATDPRWLANALEHLDEVLIDHAHCEKKAAAQALSLLQAYPEVPGLALQMAQLAREESAHLAKVLRLLESRGASLGPDPGDPYVQQLHVLIRSSPADRRLDRLLIASIVEARSCERLRLLAAGVREPQLQLLYRELAHSEHGHQALFFRLACDASSAAEALKRLDALLEREAQILKCLGVRAAIH
jgi:tRNA-(ms[2]io[6]A)-hydroxylase